MLASTSSMMSRHHRGSERFDLADREQVAGIRGDDRGARAIRLDAG